MAQLWYPLDATHTYARVVPGSRRGSAPKIASGMLNISFQSALIVSLITNRLHESEKPCNVDYWSEKPPDGAHCPSWFVSNCEADRRYDLAYGREHFWSCAALTRREQVLLHHTLLPNQPPSHCGYCGIKSLDMLPREHLTHVHKFRKCSEERYFREDHFLQHLVDSHSGTFGSWTIELGRACKRVLSSESVYVGSAEIREVAQTPSSSAPVTKKRRFSSSSLEQDHIPIRAAVAVLNKANRTPPPSEDIPTAAAQGLAEVLFTTPRRKVALRACC